MLAINFVRDRRKKLTAAQKFDHTFFRVSVGVLIGCFFVFAISAGVRLWFARSVSALEDEQGRIRREITKFEELEGEYTVFVTKLKEISKLFKTRQNKQEALLYFGDLFGPDIVISGINYNSSEEGILSFSIKAPNVFIMEEAFDLLDTPAVREEYPGISKSGIGRARDGTYTLSITVELIRGEEAEDS